MTATAQDVATKAGVSVRTVGRVVNDPALVAEAVRTKVETAIKDLGYAPSQAVRRPSTSSPLVHQVSIRVDEFTEAELEIREETLTKTQGPRLRGWEAEIVRQALDWAFRPPEGVDPMPDDFLGSGARTSPTV